MPVLLVPAESGEPIVIDKAVVFIGRHPDCDVVLNKSRKVSRKHCCFALVDDRLVVRDLGSMNGIIVNGRKILGTHALGVGDEVLIGDAKYVVRVQQAAARRRRADAPKAGTGRGTEFPLEPEPLEDAVGHRIEPQAEPEFPSAQNVLGEDDDAEPSDDVIPILDDEDE